MAGHSTGWKGLRHGQDPRIETAGSREGEGARWGGSKILLVLTDETVSLCKHWIALVEVQWLAPCSCPWRLITCIAALMAITCEWKPQVNLESKFGSWTRAAARKCNNCSSQWAVGLGRPVLWMPMCGGNKEERSEHSWCPGSG